MEPVSAPGRAALQGRRRRLQRRLRIACALLMLGKPGAAQAAERNPVVSGEPDHDPRALKLLRQMAAAYARLPALLQETVFYAGRIPLPASGQAPGSAAETPGPSLPAQDSSPLAGALQSPKEEKLGYSVRLAYSGPNRLLLEQRQIDPQTGKPLVSRWISDGGRFWSYLEDRHLYTVDRAPRSIRDFARLQRLNSGSLELLMLMGIDPFARISDEIESIRYEGETVVNETPVETVVLQSLTPGEITEARLYIGRADSLLRRMVVETGPRPAPVPTRPRKTGDPLDELLEDPPTAPLPPAAVDVPPAPAPGSVIVPVNPDSPSALGPAKRMFRYDNLIETNPRFSFATFRFEKPEGALLYEPLGNRRHAGKGGRDARIAEILKAMKGGQPIKTTPSFAR